MSLYAVIFFSISKKVSVSESVKKTIFKTLNTLILHNYFGNKHRETWGGTDRDLANRRKATKGKSNRHRKLMCIDEIADIREEAKLGRDL